MRGESHARRDHHARWQRRASQTTCVADGSRDFGDSTGASPRRAPDTRPVLRQKSPSGNKRTADRSRRTRAVGPGSRARCRRSRTDRRSSRRSSSGSIGGARTGGSSRGRHQPLCSAHTGRTGSWGRRPVRTARRDARRHSPSTRHRTRSRTESRRSARGSSTSSTARAPSSRDSTCSRCSHISRSRGPRSGHHPGLEHSGQSHDSREVEEGT